MATVAVRSAENLRRSPLPRWLTELDSQLSGRVRWDDVTLQLYSTAACFYEIKPLAVVIPGNIDDIRTAIEICARHKIPILPRGAGSSLSGNAVAEAVILDLSHHFKDVTDIDDHRVRCGVGVVLNDLQARLRIHNRKFGPDPSSGNVCVIGGMLGNNSGGPHTVKHGSMVKHVEAVNVILANGHRLIARNIPLEDIPTLDEFHKYYYVNVKRLLEKYSEQISANRPYTTKNASGYQVWDVLTETHLNLASLMVGSEGTLGVFTDAVLKTMPTVRHRGILSFYFTDLVKMGKAVKHLRALGASALEFVDRSFIQLALSFRPELKEFLPAHVRYLLYVEFEDDDVSNVENLIHRSRQIVSEREQLAEVGSFSTNEEEIERIFRVRKAATVILNKLQGKEKPVPFVEDAAIHPDIFCEFLIDLSDLLQQYSFRYAIFGHAGDGNLHLRPILNFKDDRSYRDAEDLMHRFVDLVVRHKGTLSGEHGDGRLRTPFIHKNFPRLIPLFEEIKNLFDPDRIMNPDIKVPAKKYRWNENLRFTPDHHYYPTLSRLDSDSWRLEIEKCHGCGTCREYCPVFVATGEEDDTARAKANMMRSIISGKLPVATIDTDQFYRIMDRCLNCGQCLTDCPTAVNIPGIAVLAKEKLHKSRSYRMNEFILQRGKQVSALASLVPSLSNIALSNSLVRRFMHTVVGIDRRRNLPAFSRQTKQYRSHDTSDEKKVVLWSGCAAQYNNPEGELESSLEILKKLQYGVILPDWRCCNVAKLSYGNFEESLGDLEYNVRVLLPYAIQNIPIVFTSASCGYAFMHEYLTFFNENSDIKRIAESSHDIHDFLGGIFSSGGYGNSFTSLKKKVVYHAPCHLKAQRNRFGPNDLLKMIPGLELVRIEDSCCGIAGTFGMKKENFDLSMEIGSRLFSEIERASPDFVLSGCGTCQLQINQGTGVDVIHPITLLNRSYQPHGDRAVLPSGLV